MSVFGGTHVTHSRKKHQLGDILCPAQDHLEMATRFQQRDSGYRVNQGMRGEMPP